MLATIARSARHLPAFALTIATVAATLSGAGSLVASDATVPAATATAAAPTICATAAWARATAPGIATGAIYLTITNAGDIPDDVLSASSPAAASVELHQHVMHADGGMAMVHVDRLEVPAHGSVTCAPGGYHLMLFNLTHALVAGTRVPVTLVCAHAGSVNVLAVVGDIAAMDFASANGDAPASATSATAASGCGCGN
jgi:copper(I)-binding protein